MRCVACAALFLLPLAAQQPVRFSGEVRAGCVTPPYHGPNPGDIEAWLFVDRDNPGWPGPPGSPMRDRRFQFTLNASDNQKACKELDAEEHVPPKRDPKTGDLVSGDPRYKEPPLGTGHLWIRTFELGGGRDSDSVRLLRLGFDVELVFPRNAPGK